ncbi:MAG: hypothetical protein IH598_07205 [Bacteroidales bacterium]|nr:hypothetical protein [Bacteroidales bacterium]
MKSRLLPLLCCFFISYNIVAQEQPKFGIDFSGFVKTDLMWDSRQTVSIREGHFLLFPANEVLDPNGKDINAVSNFNMLSIQSRLTGKITGPDALGARTSGLLEGEFFGTTDGDISGFRLRHAYVKLNWESAQLLVGQTWHPLFITNCYPDVVSFNTGAPFQPFSRNPQVAFTQKINKISLTFTATSQRDFVSTGPDGPSSKYLRNAGMAAWNIKVEYFTENKEKGTAFQAGLSGNSQILKPRITTPSGFKTDNSFASSIGMAYVKVKLPDVTIKAMGVIGQDTYNLTMLGGYAVETIDPITLEEDYTPLNTVSAWTDIHTNGTEWQFGLFAGYSKNNGTSDDASGNYFARTTNIDHLYRISPRVIYNSGKFRIAPEMEYTVAAFGTQNLGDGTVTDTNNIGNFRFLVGIYYFF